MSSPPEPKVLLCERDIQAIFNDEGLYRDMQAGRYRASKDRDDPVTQAKPSHGTHLPVPVGARSRTYRYVDPVNPSLTIAYVHQYEDAAGNILASGLPDPKMLRQYGVKFQKRP